MVRQQIPWPPKHRDTGPSVHHMKIPHRQDEGKKPATDWKCSFRFFPANWPRHAPVVKAARSRNTPLVTLAADAAGPLVGFLASTFCAATPRSIGRLTGPARVNCAHSTLAFCLPLQCRPESESEMRNEAVKFCGMVLVTSQAKRPFGAVKLQQPFQATRRFYHQTQEP